jgi:hypothetical protein
MKRVYTRFAYILLLLLLAGCTVTLPTIVEETPVVSSTAGAEAMPDADRATTVPPTVDEATVDEATVDEATVDEATVVAESPREIPTELPISATPTLASAVPTELPTETPVEAPLAATPAVADTAPTEMPAQSLTGERTAGNCVLCHTDKEKLLAVAAPLEEPEDALSSGVG